MRTQASSTEGRPSRPRNFLRGSAWEPRHACQAEVRKSDDLSMPYSSEKCAQTPEPSDIEQDAREQLDCQATMLQGIFIGREIPMLEPWIIDEIRRREEERRRGDRPQLELPVPDPYWPNERDSGGASDQGDKAPERGVVIIGM
jgi:hypothetical protein